MNVRIPAVREKERPEIVLLFPAYAYLFVEEFNANM